MFIEIDYNNWDRREIYEAFNPCTYYITVNMDITRFLAVLKANNYKFYPSINYVMSKVINAHSEFRYAKVDGKLGYFEKVAPLYTVLRNGNLFTHKATDYCDNFEDFYTKFLSDASLAEAGDSLYFDKPRRSDVFCVSTTPTVSFTAIAFNAPLNEKDSFIPFATVGKYYSDGDKILMPLAVEFSHEINDGYHAGKFFEWLQTELNNFNG